MVDSICSSSFFNKTDEKNGFIGIGKLPPETYPSIEYLAKQYINVIPDKSKTTFHTYYTELTSSLKSEFDKLQYHPIWKRICSNSKNDKCILHPVIEMNEIYYSNPKPSFSGRLYGAAANLLPHRDCVLFNFFGIRFYRIIIGLTSGNNDTITRFINYNINHTINKGDYMIFDFDRTLHQVIKTGLTETPRILLKIHYVVCRNCLFTENYVKFVSIFYKIYYHVARYTEQLGTDPTDFVGYFFGTLWEWPFYFSFTYTTGILSFFIMIVIYILYFRVSNRN